MDTIDKILGYRPTAAGVIKIPADDIQIVPVEDRFGSRVPNEEMDYLAEIPIQVVFSLESKKNFIRKRKDIFIEGQKQGVEAFTCLVLGEIDSDYQAIDVRLIYVLERHKPFHPLEQARFICQVKEHGGDVFYGKGGKRRGTNYEKDKLVDVVKNLMTTKDYRIGTLSQFSDHMGLIAIEGLHYCLKSSHQKLTITRIHNRNSKMKRMGLRKNIDAKIVEMEMVGKPEDEIKEVVGVMAFDALFDPKDKRRRKKKKKPGEKDGPDDDTGAEDEHDDDEETKSDSRSYKSAPIKANQFQKVKTEFAKHFDNELKINELFKSKDQVAEEDAVILDDLIEKLQLSFSAFMKARHSNDE